VKSMMISSPAMYTFPSVREGTGPILMEAISGRVYEGEVSRVTS
jgi:hypothetical protein